MTFEVYRFSNGSHAFPVSGLSTPDQNAGDGELLNADGYTTLYNSGTAGKGPGGLQGYIKGKFASPKIAPSATVNGYKRHISSGAANTRNAFYAGDSVTVTYDIKMPKPFVFGYAIDASWMPPTKKPVTDPMKDFPPSANCPEPWKIETQQTPIGAGLTPQGGQVKLTINVHDYQGKTTYAAPIVECPELFKGTKTASWTSDGADFNSWDVTVGNEKTAPAGDYKCLIKIVDNENSGSPAYLDLTAYQIAVLTVASLPPGDLIWAKSAGGTGWDEGFAVTLLSDGSVMVTGTYGDPATFGKGEPNETTLSGSAGIFVARYNQDGTLRWAKPAYGSGGEAATALEHFLMIQ